MERERIQITSTPELEARLAYLEGVYFDALDRTGDSTPAGDALSNAESFRGEHYEIEVELDARWTPADDARVRYGVEGR